jgi:hypothetical protein
MGRKLNKHVLSHPLYQVTQQLLNILDMIKRLSLRLNSGE